jgi:transcriptional regulator with XRE-family HTH domain
MNEELLYRQIGERLKRRREELGLKQGQLAEAVGLLRTSITNIESGRQRPPIHLLYALCVALNLEVGEVLPASEEVSRPSTVPISEIVKGRVGGGITDVPQRSAALLQQLLSE